MREAPGSAARGSTALDAHAPVAATSLLTGEGLRLYSLGVWPSLFARRQGCPSATKLTLGAAAAGVTSAVRCLIALGALAAAAAAAAYAYALKAFFPAIFDRRSRHRFPVLSAVAAIPFGAAPPAV